MQERGLNFPSQWDDAHYTSLLACSDPGEAPLTSGILVAHYGKGYFVYTGISWFRQFRPACPVRIGFLQIWSHLENENPDATGLPLLRTWRAVYLFVPYLFHHSGRADVRVGEVVPVNVLDYVVLFGTMLGIAVYGMWHTRGRQNLSGYLRGSGNTRWIVIGLSVMATQASAITFLSVPGQGYDSGLDFVQNYFGAPFRADPHRGRISSDLSQTECLHRLRVSRAAIRF